MLGCKTIKLAVDAFDEKNIYISNIAESQSSRQLELNRGRIVSKKQTSDKIRPFCRCWGWFYCRASIGLWHVGSWALSHWWCSSTCGSHAFEPAIFVICSSWFDTANIWMLSQLAHASSHLPCQCYHSDTTPMTILAFKNTFNI